MMTPQQKEKKLSLFMDSGVMDDMNWPKDDKLKHRIKQRINMWEKWQKDMTETKSPVTYVELKEARVGKQNEVLEAAKEGRDVNTFTVIKSHENHHAIIDQHGEILGYRFRIKPELVNTLDETTAALPPARVNARN
jgi:hypothetical protein